MFGGGTTPDGDPTAQRSPEEIMASLPPEAQATIKGLQDYTYDPNSLSTRGNQRGQMTVNDAQRLRTLEKENAQLKKMLAEEMLDKKVLKDLLSKKW